MDRQVMTKTLLETTAILLIVICFKTSAYAEEPLQGAWTLRTDTPTARYLAGSAVVNGKIYVVGGAPVSGGITKRTEEYDPAADTWTRRAEMPTARQGVRTVAVDGIVYAIGGNGGQFNNMNFRTVEAYDPATDTWTKKTDMPTPRTIMTVVTLDGKIYVMGGIHLSGAVNVEVYDPVTDTWARKADMPTARWSPAAAVAEGKIFVFGGARRWNQNHFPPFNETTIVEMYDPITDIWTRVSDMPKARFGHSATTVAGKIYIIGGANTAVHAPPIDGYLEVDVYDPATDAWTTAPNHPTGAVHHTAAVVDWKIYTIGKWTGPGGGVFPTVAEFAPTPVVLNVPAESPGAPWYAGFGRYFIPTDGNRAAIVFMRDTTCIPPEFNLLDEENIPAAFGCPVLFRGREWWHEPFVDFPFKYVLENIGSVPVYFVDLVELIDEISDDRLTWGELANFSSLKIGQAMYVKDEALNSNAPDSDGKGYGEMTAMGRLEEGGEFYVHWHGEFDPGSGMTEFLDVNIKLFSGSIPGDINNDGAVNLQDLNILEENWLRNKP
jgi:N-acetylneuraminic acid mutarotase